HKITRLGERKMTKKPAPTFKMKDEVFSSASDFTVFTDADLKLWDLTVKAVLSVLRKEDRPLSFVVWLYGGDKQTEFPEITRPMIPYLFPVLNALESAGAVHCDNNPFGPSYTLANPK